MKWIRWLVDPFVVVEQDVEDGGKDHGGKVEKKQSDEGEDGLAGKPFEGANFGFFVIFEGQKSEKASKAPN